MNYNNSVELLAPAGSKESLDAAIGEGADAVYLGLKDFNARQRAKNFGYKQVEAAVEKLHLLNKKIYITINTVFEERESKRIYNLLKYLDKIGPDAVIVQDLGIIRLINQFFPNLKIHASTQMNISSGAGVNFLSKYKVSRIVLGRELDLNQLKKIRAKTNSELEIFVHGALCLSASGVCMFSSYLGGKSANRGCCTQPCRRIYKNEKFRGYFFSPKDLMLIEYMPEIIDLGINSIKIEGRMRSAEYVATAVRAYRNIIDNYSDDKDNAVKESLNILKGDFAREKTKYFFVDENNRDFLAPDSSGATGLFLGKIKSINNINNNNIAVINTKINVHSGDTIRIHSSDDKNRKSFKIKNFENTKNEFSIVISNEFKIGDSVFLINSKNKIKYNYIISKNLDKYKRHPGNSDIPEIIENKQNSRNLKKMKHGIFVRIKQINDIYITQSMKPYKIIIDFTKKNLDCLRNNFNSFIYKKEDIIFYLDPFLSEKKEEWEAEEIKNLINEKYENFIINNIGQLNYFKNKEVNLISGPYLYSFNKYSISFLKKAGINFFISPLENNKQNLIKSTAELNRNNWFVILYSHPELFQIQSNLEEEINFIKTSDKLNNEFNVYFEENKTIVYPEKSFSIIDKIPFLQKNGFHKFIIDFSYISLKKNFYKSIMKSVEMREIIKGTTRFNWKDGFYQVKE